MMQVCEHEKCCGCMACVNICPKACIKMDINERANPPAMLGRIV